MDWIIEPLSGFKALEPISADSCTGEGTKLNHCSCTGGLVVCKCKGGLVVPSQE